MSATPWSGRLLSLDDWDAMPEDDSRRYELVEGVLRVTASPVTHHQRTVLRLATQLEQQLPPALEPIAEIDVVVSDGAVATVRKPDLIVVQSSLADTDPARYRARDVLLAVEVVSPRSVRTDNQHKFVEYADAGIESYWIIDLQPPVSLTVYRLADGDFHLDQEHAGTVEVTSPAPLRIDLDALVRSRLSV